MRRTLEGLGFAIGSACFASGCGPGVGVPVPQGPPRVEGSDPDLRQDSPPSPACDGHPTLELRGDRSAVGVAGCQIAPIAHESQSDSFEEPLDGWPTARLRSDPGSPGQDAPDLARLVANLIHVRLHAQALTPSVGVRFHGRAREPWGEVLVFDASASGAASVGEMLCRRWGSEMMMSGELLVRASDAVFVSLRMRGTVTDTEALCPELARASGRSDEPRVCNEGPISLDVSWGCIRKAEKIPDTGPR